MVDDSHIARRHESCQSVSIQQVRFISVYICSVALFALFMPCALHCTLCVPRSRMRASAQWLLAVRRLFAHWHECIPVVTPGRGQAPRLQGPSQVIARLY